MKKYHTTYLSRKLLNLSCIELCTSHVYIYELIIARVCSRLVAFSVPTFRIRSYVSQEPLIRIRSIAKIFFARRDFARAYIQKRYRGRDSAANERIRLIIRDRDCLVNYSADE